MRRVPYRAWLLIAFLVALAISAIRPTDPLDFIIEHILTVSFIIGLIVYERRSRFGPLSNTSYTLLLLFMLLHVVGAHYLYSHVPYDAWAESIFGRSISDLFGWERNHYDRLVHFLFGVLFVYPIHELLTRAGVREVRHSMIIAILFIVFLGALYEWAEWLLAVVMSPEAAENYAGQQGDMFDAHKDTMLAFIGALLSAAVVWWRSMKGPKVHGSSRSRD